MRAIIFHCLLLLFITGCFFGDSYAHRSVSLAISQPSLQNKRLSVNEPEVQEALQLIDSVFVSNGMVRNPKLPSDEDRARGAICYYGRWFVSIEDNQLQVTILEPQRHRSSPKAKELSELLSNKLQLRYGKENVKVKD